MNTGASTVVGVNMGWLGMPAVLICLVFAQSCVNAQDDAPDGWKVYQHNRDRKHSVDCAERPNFAFNVPSSWNIEMSDCDFVSFVDGDRPAELQAVVLDLPDYPEDVEAALDQMQSRWSREENVAEGGVKRVQRQGLPAISRVHTEAGSPQVACESYVDVLGIPAKSWASHGHRVVVVAAARCTDAHDQIAVTTAILDSLVLIEPY